MPTTRKRYDRVCKSDDCGKRFKSYVAPQKYCCPRCEKRAEAQRRRARSGIPTDYDEATSERDGDHEDCACYDECLTIAFRLDAPRVCHNGCDRYVARPVVMEIPVRTNWQIESAGVSNRRSGEATAEDRERHVRSKEQRPIGSQVVMPWRLVG